MDKQTKDVNTNIVKIIKIKSKQPDIKLEELSKCVKLLAMAVLALYDDVAIEGEKKTKSLSAEEKIKLARIVEGLSKKPKENKE